MSNFVEKKSIFEGMTMSQMKEAYSKMTAKERGQFAGAFVRAAKTAKKPAAKKPTKSTSFTQQAKKPAAKKPAAKKPAAKKPVSKKPTTGKSKVFKDMYAPGKMVGEDVKNRSSMPYAGKFPGEPDKEEKKKKPRNFGKGSFRNFYK
jgi:hypothetical protein